MKSSPRATNAGLLIFTGCLIGMLTFGPRSTMGFFLTPISTEYEWNRDVFGFAIALQNLVWGIAQPFVGGLADKFGARRVIAVGSIIYAAGLILMSVASDPITLHLTAGLLIGLGISGSAFFLILSVFTKSLPAHMRPLALGLGTASGSMGQFLFAPLGQAFIVNYGWQIALVIMGVIMLTVPFLVIGLRTSGKQLDAGVVMEKPDPRQDQTVMQAIREAFSHTSFNLLVTGFFVCGFHLAFITVHLPPYLEDLGFDAKTGGWAIALIGLFNIVGAIVFGVATGRFPKQYTLSFIYAARAVIIALFIFLPPSIWTVLAFASGMGLLWLSTVPPTQSLVADMFGTRHLAMLFGFVFLSHQVGSFLGVLLGSILYESTGNYDLIWQISIALGVIAALVHWPIKEDQVPVSQSERVKV